MASPIPYQPRCLMFVVGFATCCNRATRRVDVEADGLLWIVGFKKEQLCNNGCRKAVIDLSVQTHNAFLEAECQLLLHALRGILTLSKREKMSSSSRISPVFLMMLLSTHRYASRQPTQSASSRAA